MFRRMRSRLTYANVVASLALFIALGGVSYAAITLPKNSVGSKQIKASAVTGVKVKNSSLTGADVKNKSLTAADFNGSVQGSAGPAGPAGAQGSAGGQGPAGATGATGATGVAGSARAFAFVNPGACAPLCAITKSKNIASVERSLTGRYCITPTASVGLNPATDLSIAGVDFRNTTSPEGAGSAMSDSTNAGCPAGTYEVFTERTDAGTASNTVAFWFAVL